MLNGPSFIPETVKSIVIFLHGFGADGDNMFDLVDFFKNHMPNTAFYAPNALQPCAGNPMGGYQWFGLPDLTDSTLKLGLDQSHEAVTSFIESTAKHHKLTTNDVILIGFSQGCIVALDQIFRVDLKGVIGIAGMFTPTTPPATHPKSITTPTLLIHGTHDTVVPYTMLSASVHLLKNYGVEPQENTCHGMAHSINHDALKSILDFIKKLESETVIRL